MGWYVVWAPISSNGWLGGIYRAPSNSSRWREVDFISVSHQTVSSNPPHQLAVGALLHCSRSGVPPARSGIATSNNRWLLAVGPRSSVRAAWEPFAKLSAHTVQCTTGPVRCANWQPSSRFLQSLCLGSFGLVSWTCVEYLWVFYVSFRSSFEVLHPWSLSPIHFASCELQNANTCKSLVHWLCCSSNTKIT
jgi:hypothetical protein